MEDTWHSLDGELIAPPAEKGAIVPFGGGFVWGYT